MSTRVPERISFVIPTRSNARTIAACVISARDQSGDVEVVVVDNHSDDGTASLAANAGADLVLTAGPERSAQRNRGFERSTGELVAFIDSDMVLDHGAAEAIRYCFADPAVSGAVLPERSCGDGYLAASRALEKRLADGDRAVEAARVFRSTVLEEIGAYDESIAAYEDYELADRVAARGTIARSRVGVRHDEGRIRLWALARKKHYYGTQWPRARAHLASHRLGRRKLPLSVLRADLIHLPGLVILKLVDYLSLAAGAAWASLSSRRGRVASAIGQT